MSRSLSNASEETSSLDKNNGFAATMCIANDEPTLRRASSGTSFSASRDRIPAIRPKPSHEQKAIMVNNTSKILFKFQTKLICKVTMFAEDMARFPKIAS